MNSTPPLNQDSGQASAPPVQTSQKPVTSTSPTPPAAVPGIAFTRFLIPLMMSGYAVILIIQIVRALSQARGDLSSGDFGSLFGGSTGMSIVLSPSVVSLFYVLTYIIIIVATFWVAFKIYHGRKVALALLTGSMALYLLQRPVQYYIAFSIARYAGSSSQAVLILVMAVEVFFTFLLIRAWTKEKAHYT